MADKNTAFNAAEQEYFDSAGQKPIETTPAPVQEIEPEAPASEQEQQPDNRTVPLAALREERAMRKEAEARAKAEAERLERAERRMDEINRRFEQYTSPLPKEPTVDEDPVAVLKSQQEWRRQEEQRRLQEQQNHQFLNVYAAHVAEYRADNPDYDQAFTHWRKDLVLELQEGGLPLPQAIEQANMYERGLVQNALRDGKNPAERIYNLSKRRGYKAAAAAAPSNVDKIEAIARGQDAARSLGGASGTAPRRLTLETIANMSDREFAKLSDDEFRRIMGG